MNIRLAEQLNRLSDEVHDPSTITVAAVERRAGAARRRLTRRVLAALVAIAAVAAFILWYQPTLGPLPSPSPSPNPSESMPSWWRESYETTELPNEVVIPADEAARRCKLRPGEVFDPYSPLLVGSLTAVFASQKDLPKRVTSVDPTTGETHETYEYDDKKMRWCNLGYRDVPSSKGATPEEFTHPAADFKRLCSVHSGYPFGDVWHVVTSVHGKDSSRSVTVALANEVGGFATCWLTEGVSWAQLSFMTPTPATADDCLPDLFVNVDAMDATHADHDEATQVSLSGIALAQPPGKPTVERLHVRLAKQVLADAPVVNGVVLLDEVVKLTPPLRVAKDSWLVPVTIELLDAKGGIVKSCQHKG